MNAASWIAFHRRNLKCQQSATDVDIRIMSHERRDLSVGGTERDSRVNTHGERGDTVLEEMSHNLHDRRLMLNDGDIFGELKNSLQSCQKIRIRPAEGAHDAASKKQSSGTRVS